MIHKYIKDKLKRRTFWSVPVFSAIALLTGLLYALFYGQFNTIMSVYADQKSPATDEVSSLTISGSTTDQQVIIFGEKDRKREGSVVK